MTDSFPDMSAPLLARATGVVEAVPENRADRQEIRVRCGSELRRAINYPAITGDVRVGDRVFLNTWAVSMGLGTGGVDFVAAVHREGEILSAPPGHIMKLRYTPSQTPVLAAEAPESPHHSAIATFESLQGAPVICAELHSQVAPAAAAARWATRGQARVVYVMTDGAALPIAFSRSTQELRERGILDSTVTCGQALGGDFEAVNLHSGLAVARAAAGADVIIVSQGPGGTGTATGLGFSGLDQGVALNAAASLGGTPIAVARLSFAERRARHRGLSHHTVTVLARVALCRALVPIPRLSAAENRRIERDLKAGGIRDRHDFVMVDAASALDALEGLGICLSTMGRGLQEDRAFFLAAAAAGIIAGERATDELRKDAPSHE